MANHLPILAKKGMQMYHKGLCSLENVSLQEHFLSECIMYTYLISFPLPKVKYFFKKLLSIILSTYLYFQCLRKYRPAIYLFVCLFTYFPLESSCFQPTVN